jgi:uncharacterized protein YdaU (DUF1376 family)
MAKSPAFQFYVNDWLGSLNIMLMTPAEEGGYIRLLAISWGTEDCGLPDDDEQLALLSRLGEGWLNGASTKIRKCFIQKGNRLYNKRLLEERKKQEEWREKSRMGGIKSGKSRKIKYMEYKGSLNHPRSGPVEPKGNSSSSSSSSSSSLNKEKNKRSISHSEVKKFLTHYGERFKFHFGTDPVIEWGKDGTLIKNLLKLITFENLKELLEAFFCSEDKFIQKTGYTIGIFKSQINKLQIGEPIDGMDLWLKTKEGQDARNRQKEIFAINEKIKGNIPDKS